MGDFDSGGFSGYGNVLYFASQIVKLEIRFVMELVVIEKNAYLRLKQQVEDLSTQIEAVKKKFGSVEKEK